MRRETPIAAAILVTALAGCGPRSLDSKDLSSSLRATASLAAETNVFIRYLRNGDASATFARGHAEYLARELDDERETLFTARVEERLRPAFLTCREEQDQLSLELARLELALTNPDKLAQIAERVQNIGMAAGQARAGL